MRALARRALARVDILHGRDVGREFPRLTPDDRAAILEILLATEAGLPDYWS